MASVETCSQARRNPLATLAPNLLRMEMLFGLATKPRQLDSTDLTAGAAAWTMFWQEQGTQSRCLAGASADLHRALNDHWQFFANTLPSGARVLDVGCGAGAVARSLGLARPDLKIIGIDFAEIPTGDDSRVEILSNIPMETLPFPCASFGAAVSQFGYEYSQTEVAAKELARVLAADAPFSFLVHHAESPILANCTAHTGALKDLSGARLGAIFMSGDAAAFDRELSLLGRLYPGESIIEQAARGLRLHFGKGELQRAAIWQAVTDALAPELLLQQAIGKSCVAADQLDHWLAPLNAIFRMRQPSVVRLRGGEPIAWKIEGTRKRESAR